MTKKSAKRAISMLRKWGYLCIICGQPFANLACVTVEHLMPRSITKNVQRKPKQYELSEKLAPSHFRCNQCRGTQSLGRGRQIIETHRAQMSPTRFESWLNSPVPRKGGSPPFCFISILDAEWFLL